MTRTRGTLLLLALAFSLAAPVAANADGGIKVGWYSQQVRPSRAAVGSHIQASAARAPAARERGGTPAGTAQRVVVTIRTAHSGANLPPPFPPLSTSSPILRHQHPFGPGSFWYTDAAGHACQYVPDSVTPCFTLVGPGTNSGAVRLSPSAVAESLTRRVELAPGEINTSPSRAGLTGAPSWFWLDPAPHRQSLSISLAGETVNVIADPTVEWRFGDGATFDGGPGIPYQADASPADAIQHAYETRCLPGDQGHDPYVLASCSQDGYSVEALVIWHITYRAAGPVGATGTLPTRTTDTSTSYPVSESRAFLVAGGGQ
ncbi:MAG TPA: hypothetical protein VFM96_02290 [Gaiellaceae bacterium]|nr:hypothetical protein [Gaiellaceae bacterium]